MSTETQNTEGTSEAQVVENINETIFGVWNETPAGLETKLSTGEVVLIERGKGKHIKQAQRLMQKPEDYDTALQAVLIKIDGANKVFEDFGPWFDNLPLGDAQRIANKFGMVNFL